MIRTTTVPSGLRVVTEAMPGAHSVSVGVWVAVGARDEPAELAGISHFLEHTLFKGTEGRTGRELAEVVECVGGDMNAFTTKEYTAFYCRVPASQTALAVEVLADVLTRPSLRDADIDSERQVILDELLMDEDAPDDKVHTLLAGSLFGDHPLGRETAGSAATVAAIGSADLRSYFATWYRPDLMVVAAAGALDHDEVVRLVADRFPPGTGGPARPPRTAPATAGAVLAVQRRPLEQVHVALGVPGLPRRDPDSEALEVAVHVLGGGPASRLFDEIREQRGLAYHVNAGRSAYADAGAVTVYVASAPQHVDEVLELVHAEIRRMAAEGVTERERDVAVGYLTGSMLLGLEDTGSRMSRLGAQLSVHGQVRTVEEQLRRFRAVTTDDVQRVAARLFSQRWRTAVVGPVSKRRLERRSA